MATFIKASTNVLAASGPLGMLAHWPVYAVVVCGIVGSVVQQAALQVGPLSVSQPLIVVVDPAVAIVLSIWIFDERFNVTVDHKIAAGMAFCVMALGVMLLSRAAPIDLDPTTDTKVRVEWRAFRGKQGQNVADLAPAGRVKPPSENRAVAPYHGGSIARWSVVA